MKGGREERTEGWRRMEGEKDGRGWKKGREEEGWKRMEGREDGRDEGRGEGVRLK